MLKQSYYNCVEKKFSSVLRAVVICFFIIVAAAVRRHLFPVELEVTNSGDGTSYIHRVGSRLGEVSDRLVFWEFSNDAKVPLFCVSLLRPTFFCSPAGSS